MTKFNQKIFQIIDIENSSFGLTFLQCSSCKFRKYFDLEEEDEKNLELRESKKDEKCRVCSTRLSMDYKFSLDLTLYSKEKGFLHSNICDLNLAMQNFLGISPSKIVDLQKQNTIPNGEIIQFLKHFLISESIEISGTFSADNRKIYVKKAKLMREGNFGDYILNNSLNKTFLSQSIILP